ncbi:MAG: GNAT family N-acetyltransferase [Pseudomonadota bacterium]
MFSIRQGNKTEADMLRERLLASLRQTLPQGSNDEFALVATGQDDSVAGGLTAATAYGWLLVKVLWVDPTYRRSGVASALLAEAEARAVSLGCHAAWLDTSNPDAMRFYCANGFTTFARLTNNDHESPPAHCRWFLKKPL